MAATPSDNNFNVHRLKALTTSLAAQWPNAPLDSIYAKGAYAPMKESDKPNNGNDRQAARWHAVTCESMV